MSDDTESKDNRYPFNLADEREKARQHVQADYERVKNAIATMKQMRDHERKMDALRERLNHDER